MKYDIDKEGCYYGAIYDANGIRIMDPCKTWDTETGECVCLVTDINGAFVIDYEKGEVVRETRFFPAPLTFVPFDDVDIEENHLIKPDAIR